MKNKNLIYTLLWAAIIAALSFTPGNYIPAIEWTILAPDTIAHFVFYGVLVFLICNYLFTVQINTVNYFYSFVIAFIYGYLIEYVQGNFIPGRFFDLYDVLSNSIGAIAGLFAYIGVRNSNKFN